MKFNVASDGHVESGHGEIAGILSIGVEAVRFKCYRPSVFTKSIVEC